MSALCNAKAADKPPMPPPIIATENWLSLDIAICIKLDKTIFTNCTLDEDLKVPNSR